MKDETVRKIVNDLRLDEGFDLQKAKQISKTWTNDEIREAVARYGQMRDVEIEILDDVTVGALVLQYEERTGEVPDKEDLIEEVVLIHIICLATGEDVLEYNLESVDAVLEEYLT